MSAQWKVVKCPCGDTACKRYGLNVGMFPQGAGFDLADAILAAAAPDLLELAKQYAAECGECNGTGRRQFREDADSDPCPDCEGIRAVIAKAELPR